MFYYLYKIFIISLLSTCILLLFQFTQLKQKLTKDNKKIINKSQKSMYNAMFQLYIDNREKFYLKGRQYVMKRIGKNYDESHVITFQDKLNYLLIHESPEDKTKIVDKIQLRNYSYDILGKDICPPILKIYNNAEEINLDELPEKFVLKCNHGCAMNIFCENKSTFNLSEAKRKLNFWMQINYGFVTFEYQYLNIKRKIFVEKFLDDDIINYKFSCFNGEPKIIRVKGKINGTNLYNVYYVNWTKANIELDKKTYFLTNRFKKPIHLQKMIKYAKLLSSEFGYSRVDFYEVQGVLYLSEITFTPFNACMRYKKKEMAIYLGNLINISKIKERKYSINKI